MGSQDICVSVDVIIDKSNIYHGASIDCHH